MDRIVTGPPSAFKVGWLAAYPGRSLEEQQPFVPLSRCHASRIRWRVWTNTLGSRSLSRERRL